MKYLMLLVALTIGDPSSIMAQEFTDQKTMPFDLHNIEMVHVHNHKGTVTIKGTDSNQGKIVMTRTLKSASKATLEAGKEKIYLDSIFTDGKLYFFINAPNHIFKVDENGQGYYQSEWNYGNRNKKDRFDIDFEFTLTVELPKTTSINASTHEKSLEISNLTGRVVANNHHDNVTLQGMQNDVEANSHHGDVTVHFAKNPPGTLKCDTHHGEIKVSLRTPLSADATMKSHHGSFYADFDYQTLARQVSSKQDSHRGTKFLIGDGTSVRIGQGGLKMDFRTHHGDVYILKNNK